MNKLWKTHVPQATLSFTLAMVFTAVFNLVKGHESGDYVFVLELLGLLIVLQFIDYGLSRLAFKSRAQYLITEFILMYICFLGISVWGNWFGYTFTRFILFSLVFLAFFVLLNVHYYCTLKRDAEEINSELGKKSRQNSED